MRVDCNESCKNNKLEPFKKYYSIVKTYFLDLIELIDIVTKERHNLLVSLLMDF